MSRQHAPEALESLHRKAVTVERTLAAFGAMYFDAVARGRGDAWSKAVTSFVELCDLDMPTRADRGRIGPEVES